MKTGFFEETPHVRSMMRLMSFLLLFFFFFICSLYIYGGNKIEVNFIGFVFVILIAVFVPKYLQSLAEIAARFKGVETSTKSTEINKTTETTEGGK